MKTPELGGEYRSSPENNLLKTKTRLEELLVEMSSQDFYVRLGVQSSATNDEISKAFRSRFASFHPDNKTKELKDIYDYICRLLSEAKTALIDPSERAKYDGEQNVPRTKEPQKSSYTSTQKREKHQKSAKESKEDALKDIKNNISKGVHYFVHIRDEWVNGGIITKEEVNNSIKDTVISLIKLTISKGGRAFKIKIDQWIDAEVITKEEIIKLPEIRKEAIKNMEDEIFLGPYLFQTNLESWIEVGIVTKEQIIKLPEIKESVIENIKKEISLEPENFETIMNGWIEVGVITREEIIKLPEIKQKVLDLMEPKIIRGEVKFRESIRPWTAVGIITEEEVEKIIKDFLSTL